MSKSRQMRTKSIMQMCGVTNLPQLTHDRERVTESFRRVRFL